MAGEPSPLVASLSVAAGGAVGSVLRYQIGRWVTNLAGPGNAFPWGTLAVNIAGSLAMGALIGWLAFRQSLSLAQIGFIALILVGVVGLNLSTAADPRASSPQSSA